MYLRAYTMIINNHNPLLFVHPKSVASLIYRYMCVLAMHLSSETRGIRDTERGLLTRQHSRRAMEKLWLLGIQLRISHIYTSDSAVAHARPVQRIEQLHLPYPATSRRHFPAYYGPRWIAASGKELFNEILRRENSPLKLARSGK